MALAETPRSPGPATRRTLPSIIFQTVDNHTNTGSALKVAQLSVLGDPSECFKHVISKLA